tara:strand:- start:4170 stop:4289 length:120 start_codon:yes stop_codon:yes gene_type:complete
MKESGSTFSKSTYKNSSPMPIADEKKLKKEKKERKTKSP